MCLSPKEEDDTQAKTLLHEVKVIIVHCNTLIKLEAKWLSTQLALKECWTYMYYNTTEYSIAYSL